MKLSPTQIKTLDKMEVGKWYSSFTLQVKLTTLYALEKKGLVKSKGYGFEPTILIQWKKS